MQILFNFSLEIQEVSPVSHGNKVLGNGQDAAPPGHGFNFNDGPGTSPGNPGAKNWPEPGNDREKELERATNNVGPQKEPARVPAEALSYLNVNQLDKHFSEFDRKSGNSQSGKDVFSRWQAMNRALAEQAANFDRGDWQHDNKGADIANLGKAAEGFLGSTRAFGTDSFTLAGGSGTTLDDFKGLKGGLKALR